MNNPHEHQQIQPTGPMHTSLSNVQTIITTLHPTTTPLKPPSPSITHLNRNSSSDHPLNSSIAHKLSNRSKSPGRAIPPVAGSSTALTPSPLTFAPPACTHFNLSSSGEKLAHSGRTRQICECRSVMAVHRYSDGLSEMVGQGDGEGWARGTARMPGYVRLGLGLAWSLERGSAYTGVLERSSMEISVIVTW